MSKSLRSYPDQQVMSVAMRRASGSERGCGYWAAVSYLNKKGIKTKEQRQADAVSEILKNTGADVFERTLIRREEKHAKFPRRQREKPVSSLGERSKRTLEAFRAR